jgi:flagellar motor switch protein FliG
MEALPMGALTEHRIRQLAIAIQQMGSDDASRLLDHLPESLAMRIRGQFGSLDKITPDEQRLAIETIEELLQSDESKVPEKANTQDLGLSIEDYPIEAIVEVLGRERPIVIATILKNLPSRLGQSIVPRLDLDKAKEALDWMPRLDITHQRVLDSVLAEFYNQVKTVGSKIESQHLGQKKVRELLSVLQATNLTKAHGLSDQSTAMEPKVERVPGNILKENSKASALSPEPSSPFVIPLNRKTSREESLEALLKLDDLDLLRVLYSHNAQDVKRFLAGANKAMRMRIESLTPRHALKKLRKELASVPVIDEKAWKELAGQFAQAAIELTQTEPSNEEFRVSA